MVLEKIENGRVRMEKVYLSEVYTASSAAKIREIPYSTLKDDLVRYGKFESHIKRGLVRKEGRVWLITKQALDEVYGEKYGR